MAGYGHKSHKSLRSGCSQLPQEPTDSQLEFGTQEVIGKFPVDLYLWEKEENWIRGKEKFGTVATVHKVLSKSLDKLWSWDGLFELSRTEVKVLNPCTPPQPTLRWWLTLNKVSLFCWETFQKGQQPPLQAAGYWVLPCGSGIRTEHYNPTLKTRLLSR